MNLRTTVIACCCIFFFTRSFAQENTVPEYDSAYFESFPTDLVLRTYLSQKYTTLELKNGRDAPRLRYRPNTNLNLGVGFTYRNFSLNLAYGFGFLNPDSEKGKNKKLDLQARIYTRKWAVDFFGQFYKGYYTFPKGRGQTTDDNYYIRPDLKVNLAGISVYRVFNHRRFTLRSVFMQDEWQKKSAGSLLAGIEMYYGNVKDDSALVPSLLRTFYDPRSIKSVRLFQIGPGVGYAYTQVLPANFFLSGSLTISGNFGLVQESGTSETTNRVGINATMQVRAGAGFNNGNWVVNAFWLNGRDGAKGAPSGNNYVLNTGNVRLIVAKRIQPGKGLRKLLRPLDKIFK